MKLWERNKIDKEMADNLYNHIKGRLADLLNKVMQERNRLKYMEYLEYIKKNPFKNKNRRLGFLQVNNPQSFRSTTINERRLSQQNRIATFLHKKCGSAIFIQRNSAINIELPETRTKETNNYEKKKRITKSHSQKAKLRVQSIFNFEETARNKQNVIEKKLKEAEIKRIKKLEKTIDAIKKDDIKREHKLNNFLHIEEEKESKRK